MSIEEINEAPPIDWTRWEPAGEGDVRSPCPVLNSLANHYILPHDGRRISKSMAVTALKRALSLDTHLAQLLTLVALTTNPKSEPKFASASASTINSNPKPAIMAPSFDLNHLNRHGIIEHDVSLSRNDFALGDNHSFDAELWHNFIATHGNVTTTDPETVSRARYQRLVAAKMAHRRAKKRLGYGVKEFLLSYGESALLLGVLGDPKNGRIPLHYLRVVFEEERFPFLEGWKPNTATLRFNDLNHLIWSLVRANKHKTTEAVDVARGTIYTIRDLLVGLVPTSCVVM